jgi:hypothetical protein
MRQYVLNTAMKEETAHTFAFTSPAGAPACIIKSLIILCTTVPSYLPEAHNARKFSLAFGTASQNISSFMGPCVVLSCFFLFS